MGIGDKVISRKVILGLIGVCVAATLVLLLTIKWEGWVTVTIDSGTSGAYYTGQCNSIGIDGNDRVHISYLSLENYVRLKYATNASGSWVTSNIEDLKTYNSAKSLTSIAIDPNGKVHISYSDNGIPAAKYATNATGVWGSNIIKSQIDTYDIPIAIGSKGKAHISYFEHVPKQILRYATNASGAWVISSIDNLPNLDVNHIRTQTSSIAIDSAGKVHICYFHPSNLDLKYATNASGAWVKTVIDSTGTVGRFNSIAIDSNKKVHISYWDETNNALKYATNSAGSWYQFVVDNIGGSGYPRAFTSIAIDSKNTVHISYNDAKNGTLKYATNASGKWVTCGLAKLGTSDGFNSIAIGSNDKAHISYYDVSKGGGGELKYMYYSTSPLLRLP